MAAGVAEEHEITTSGDVQRAVEHLARWLLGNGGGQPVRHDVTTPDAVWAVHAHPVPSDNGTLTAVLTVAPRSLELPPHHELRPRYGFTRREAVVARLIAGRRSTAEIARELHISPHTARHHTENVFLKLGVRSRDQVRLHLLDLALELEP